MYSHWTSLFRRFRSLDVTGRTALIRNFVKAAKLTPKILGILAPLVALGILTQTEATDIQTEAENEGALTADTVGDAQQGEREYYAWAQEELSSGDNKWLWIGGGIAALALIYLMNKKKR